MEVDGKVLIGTSPPTPGFPGPTTFEEYDPTANTMSIVTTTGPNLTNSPFLDRMLDLPNGQVLVSDSSDQLFAYTPVGTPQAAWRPTVTSIAPNLDGTFTLRGTQLNGLSEGAAYGDDAQMATNYPIVEFTDAAGNVTFARTTNWSSTGVATGTTPESVTFTLPAGKTLNGFVTVSVSANGISSVPTPVIDIVIAPASGNVTIQVDPANAASIQIINNTTGGVIAIRPNNTAQLISVTSVPGNSGTTTVTIDERNGIVNVPVVVQGSDLPGDGLTIVANNASDNLVVSPTSATTANISYAGSATYSFQDIGRFSFEGAGNGVTLQDTVGGAAMTVNGSTQQYDGGTPMTLNDTTSLASTTPRRWATTSSTSLRRPCPRRSATRTSGLATWSTSAAMRRPTSSGSFRALPRR